jgi:hypothetical protein
MGIIDDFHVPGLSRRPVNSEEFYRTEFKAIDFSQEEMKRFHGFINSIGKVSEADFMSVFSEELVRISLIYSLREKGYIDSLNRLSSDFWQLGSYANLEFNHFIKNVVKISAAKRKEVYKILEEKYKGLTFSSDKDAIDYIKKEFIFQVLYPRLPGAFYFFKDIRDLLNRKKRKARDFGIENPEYPDYIDIATSKTMGNKSASMINSYLEFLIKVGLVEEIDERYYRPVRMYDTQMDRIESLFGDIHAKIDLEDAQMIEMFTTKILEVTEPLWAKRFLDDTKRVINKLEKAKSGSGDSRVLLAFDKTWIPAGQEKHVLDMLRALGKLSNIELVMSDDPFALASDIKTRKKDIPWENVITFVDRSFLETEADKPALFWEIYKLYDTGNKSHIIGIDNSNLSEDTYIRLLEMVSMAYEHAFDIWGSPLRHPHIEVVISKTKAHPVDLSDIRKYIIFIPDSEKINIDHIPAVYEAQIRVLTSA